MARSFVLVMLVAFALAAPGVAAAEEEKTDRADGGGKADAPGQAKKAADAAPPAEPTPAPVPDAAPPAEPDPTSTTTAPAAEATQPTPQAAASNEGARPAEPQPAPAVASEPDLDALLETDRDLGAPLLPPGAAMDEGAGGAFLPRAPFARAPADESAAAPARTWDALWWSIPLLGAAGIGAVLVLRRREAPLERATRIEGAPAARADTPLIADADFRAMLQRGQAAVTRGAYGEAIACFDAVLLAMPSLAVAHFCRGVCLATMGRTAEAYGALESAVTHDPSDASYRIHFARVAIALGRGTDAMAALEPVAVAVPEVQAALLEDPALSGLRDHPRFLAMCGAL